jgi:hypothetical protein
MATGLLMVDRRWLFAGIGAGIGAVVAIAVCAIAYSNWHPLYYWYAYKRHAANVKVTVQPGDQL